LLADSVCAEVEEHVYVGRLFLLLRGAFQHRRCLLPADGFYDWSGFKVHKRATFFHLKDDGLFAFAGVYENWEGDGEVLDKCALLTRDAN
jgi:putative SOS response-associated peptidase YedK